MNRSFNVTVWHRDPDADAISTIHSTGHRVIHRSLDNMRFSQGAKDAGRSVLTEVLPGYEILDPCNQGTVWRAEAYNHEKQLGAVLYITEV